MKQSRIRAFPRKYLWQAPRGLALKLTRNSDERLRNYIADRDVAIVGNAASLLSTDLGERIDAHGVVIRMNKGFIRHPASQGTRTDIVSLSPEVSGDEIAREFSPDLICMLTHKLRHMHLTEQNQLAKLVFYRHFYWFKDRQHIGRRPSSGFMMISWLMRIGLAGRVTLYGFDFGKTPTHYNPDGYQTPHNFEREGEIITGWEEQGKLRIVPSAQE